MSEIPDDHQRAQEWEDSQRKAWYFEGWSHTKPGRIWVPPWLYEMLVAYVKWCTEANDRPLCIDMEIRNEEILTFKGIPVLPAWTNLWA